MIKIYLECFFVVCLHKELALMSKIQNLMSLDVTVITKQKLNIINHNSIKSRKTKRMGSA